MSSLLKVLMPLAAIAVIYLLAKYKYHYSAREDLLLRRPRLLPAISWIAIAISWMLLSDWLVSWRGPWDFAPWKAQTFTVSALRVLAVCFIGPIAEELIFRGLFFRKLTKTGKLRPELAVIILAAAWALIHYTYTPAVIFIIFVEGLLLGFALIRTKSIYVPMAMHIAWNLYAIW